MAADQFEWEAEEGESLPDQLVEVRQVFVVRLVLAPTHHVAGVGLRDRVVWSG